ncbi:hypothetical protein QTP88_021302 [Uroleucon formosanum]
MHTFNHGLIKKGQYLLAKKNNIIKYSIVLLIMIFSLQKFLETPDIINQESFSNVKQNESSLTVNEKLLNVALENEITTDISLSKSSEFSDSEIPTAPSVCRICLQSDFDETNKCISPCFCRGSMSKVHRTCLEKWLLQASSSICEICTFEYKTRRIKYDMAYRVVSFSACWSILCADFFFCFWTSCRVQHHILNWYNFYKNNQSIVLESEPQNSIIALQVITHFSVILRSVVRSIAFVTRVSCV